MGARGTAAASTWPVSAGSPAPARLAEVTRAHGKACEVQSWGYTLTQAANLHFMLAHPHCTHFEQATPFEKVRVRRATGYPPGRERLRPPERFAGAGRRDGLGADRAVRLRPARVLDMTVTIERVEVLCLQDPQAAYYRFEGSYRNVVVLVHGDNGLVGIGESDAPPEIVKSLIEMPPYNQRSEGLADIVTGQAVDDPRPPLGRDVRAHAVARPPRRRDARDQRARYRHLGPLRPVAGHVPVSEALGGSRHDRLPAYATIYPLEDTPARIDAQVLPLLERGFRHLKICVEPWWNEPDRVRRNLTHLRDLVGFGARPDARCRAGVHPVRAA